MDRARNTCSTRFACPVCSYALGELEPRLFSFNSPQGACPSLRRHRPAGGVRPRRGGLPVLSLASGAIKGWDRRNGYYFAMLLESLARTTALTWRRRSSRCPPGCRTVVLHGSGPKTLRSATSWTAARKRARPSSRSTLRGHPAQHGAALPRDRFDRRCARTWPATAAPSPAPTARAHACAARRATCAWAKAPRRAPSTR